MKKIILMASLLILLTACGGREEDSSKSQYRNKIVYIMNEDKPFTGMLIHRHSDKQTASKMTYKDGVLHGKYIFYCHYIRFTLIDDFFNLSKN